MTLSPSPALPPESPTVSADAWRSTPLTTLAELRDDIAARRWNGTDGLRFLPLLDAIINADPVVMGRLLQTHHVPTYGFPMVFPVFQVPETVQDCLWNLMNAQWQYEHAKRTALEKARAHLAEQVECDRLQLAIITELTRPLTPEEEARGAKPMAITRAEKEYAKDGRWIDAERALRASADAKRRAELDVSIARHRLYTLRSVAGLMTGTRADVNPPLPASGEAGED